MPDLADVAECLREEHLARSLSRIAADIPAGVRGECEECGEDMPRLVAGRCAFCRDGRPHPIERAPTTPITPAIPATPKKEEVMPNPPPSPDRRQVSFPATGDVLKAIEARVILDGSFAAATIALIERGIALPTSEALLADLGVGGTPIASARDLSAFDTDELLDEIRNRTSGAGRIQDLERDLSEVTGFLAEAVHRAEAAEARLARVNAALAEAQ